MLSKVSIVLRIAKKKQYIYTRTIRNCVYFLDNCIRIYMVKLTNFVLTGIISRRMFKMYAGSRGTLRFWNLYAHSFFRIFTAFQCIFIDVIFTNFAGRIENKEEVYIILLIFLCLIISLCRCLLFEMSQNVIASVVVVILIIIVISIFLSGLLRLIPIESWFFTAKLPNLYIVYIVIIFHVFLSYRPRRLHDHCLPIFPLGLLSFTLYQ